MLLAVQEGGGQISAAQVAIPARSGLVLVREPDIELRFERFTPEAAVAVAFRPEIAGPRSGLQRRVVPFPGDPRWAATFARHETGFWSLIPEIEQPLWNTRLNLLAWELENRRPGFAAAARGQLAGLLIGVSRLAFAGDRHPPARIEEALEVVALIEERYAERLSLEDVARALGRSPRHLSRLVREVTGETVMHWIDERRMEEARRLLLESDDTVEQIAFRTGYTDAGYFRRRFRRGHGVPPGQWRRDHGQPPPDSPDTAA